MGMHGYMSFYICRCWKITFSSRFLPFTLLNQGRYCTVSLGLFSLSDYILLFFFYLFIFVIVIFTSWSCFFPPFSLPFPQSSPTPVHPSSFSLQKRTALHWISSYSDNLTAYQGTSSPTKSGKGSPRGGNGPKSSQESQRQALLLLL